MVVTIEKVFSFPSMGKYTNIFFELLKALRIDVVRPPPITQNTIKLGVKYSPDMICYPFKVTLGNMIECIENGATDIVMYNNCGTCRFRQYYIVQDLILKNLNYKFKIHQIRPRSLIGDLKKLNNRNSYVKVIKVIMQFWKMVKNMEETYHGEFDSSKTNIAVIGEIFTVLEPSVNMDIISRLRKKGVKTHSFVNIRHLITDAIGGILVKRDADFKEAQTYLDGELGGHAIENIRDTIYFTKNKIDGIIHLLPLSCMPETTIEPIINKLCCDSGTPLLRLSIDETNSEVNFETRVETFVELIKRKKAAQTKV